MLENDYSISHYLSHHKDPFPVMKALLSYPLWNWTSQYFLYTREYEKGLDFIEHAYSIIYANGHRVSPSEYEKWDSKLIIKKLVLLDYMNSWDEYIEYFDEVFDTKKYSITYSNTVKENIQDKYIISEDEQYLYVHFLWSMNERYTIFCRKSNRQKAGKKTDHLRRHHKYMLPEDEVKRRFEAIINKLHYVVNI